MRTERIRVINQALRIIGISLILTSFSAIALARPPTVLQASRRKPSTRVRITRDMVAGAQQRLIDLGYWIEGADGKWGDASRHGLIAFQKVEGRARTGRLTQTELQALASASRPLPQNGGPAHIEVDLTRQVLFVVDDSGTISKILPVSSGNGKLFTVEGYTQPAVTPTGRFRVQRKLPGWRKSPLGLLYFPNYIVGGIAIHGNPAVPAQPASHGCIRIPMFASEEFSQMTPVGTPVILYGAGPPAQSLDPPQSK